MKYDAVLREWSIVSGDPNNMRFFIHVKGKIFDDKKGRFKNGDKVSTSPITSLPNANGVITTKNSSYKLEPWI